MKLLKEMTHFLVERQEIEQSLKENNGKLVLKGVIQRADATNQNGRVYPKEILEREIDNYKKIVKERRAHGELDHCLMGTDSVLTLTGWKLIKDIADDEVILSLNTDTSTPEYQQIKRKVVVENYTGTMYTFSNGKNFSMTVSPNHNVLLWDRQGKSYKILAKDLAKGIVNRDSKIAHSSIKHNFVYEPESPKTHFKVPGLEQEIPIDLWAAFFGIWIAEGDVAVCQKKTVQTQMIQDEIMTPISEDLTTYWNLRSKPLREYMSQFGNSHTKFLPEEVFTEWPASARTELLKWMLLGDGKNRTAPVTKQHIKEYATTSRRLADDIHRLYVTLGYKPFIKVQQPKDNYVLGRLVEAKNCSPVFVVAGNVSNTYLDSRFFSVSESQLVNENIYCVTVKNGTFMAMDTATKATFWTGNCDEPVVNLKNVSHIITDIWMENNGDVMGKAEVLKTPMGMILRALVEDQVTVGISSRALGSVEHINGVDYVQDDLHFVCWDFVSDPSTHNAFMFKESRDIDPKILKKIFTRSDRVDRTINDLFALHEKIKAK